MEIKVRNWCIKFDESGVSGRLLYEGKIIPRWGCVMSFQFGKYSVYYAYPKAVPAYIKNKLEALRERM